MRHATAIAALAFSACAAAQGDPGLRIVSGPADALAIAATGDVVKAIGSDGALGTMTTNRPAQCASPRGVAMHPGGRFVLLTSDTGTPGAVCVFAIDAQTRTLELVQGSPAPAGRGTRAIAADPGGRFVYATNAIDGSISGYSIDATTGELRALAGSAFVSTDTGTTHLAIDPFGRYVYASNDNAGNGTISGFAIDRDNGGLTHVPKSPLPVAPAPGPLAIDPRGRFLYAGGATSTAFAIDPSTGQLTPVATSFAPSPRGLAMDPSGRHLFATYADNHVVSYAIAASGALTEAGNAATGANPRGVAVSRDGTHLYVANAGDGTVSRFRIDDGKPIALDAIAAAGATELAAFGVLAPVTSVAQGAPFVRKVEAIGGRLPLTWSVAQGSLPPGLQLDPQTGWLSGTPSGEGTSAFTARVVDAFGGFASRDFTFSTRAAASATAVEFYNAALDHYFVTWVAAEIAALDQGTAIQGWKRTGLSLPTLTAPRGDTSPLCRFYIPPALGNSHFFGRGGAECNATAAAHPTFVLEDPAFMHMVLPSGGTCPAATLPVYRVFSARPDANHRYTTDRAVRDAMVAKGWLAEGDGPDLVVMCAP
ncbi:MAG: beta-propeller fold lactonase family protein [Burkholderiales bacterium]